MYLDTPQITAPPCTCLRCRLERGGRLRQSAGGSSLVARLVGERCRSGAEAAIDDAIVALGWTSLETQRAWAAPHARPRRRLRGRGPRGSGRGRTAPKA